MISPLLLLPMDISAPTIEYGLLAPVLVDLRRRPASAYWSRRSCPASCAGLRSWSITFVASLAWPGHHAVNWWIEADTLMRRRLAGPRRTDLLHVDDPVIFSAASIMMFAERKIEIGPASSRASASAVPGTLAEREAIAAASEHTEVFPLALFARVAG